MYDERFARQYRYEPPSEFPLTLPFASIVHHLSGPNTNAHTQTSLNWLVGCWSKYSSCHFNFARKLITCELAHVLDSLVRVSRRVEKNHLVRKIACEWATARTKAFQQESIILSSSPQTYATADNCTKKQHTQNVRINLSSWTGSFHFPFSNFKHF